VTEEEFEFFVSGPGIEWQEDEEAIYFRDTRIPWYLRSETNALRVEKVALNKLTLQQLEAEISRGVKVEHITRVTGYMSKVNQWNPGKLGELRDRHREAKDGNTVS